MTCRYDRAWMGQCRADAGPTGFCSEHEGKACWCGSQAVRECEIASSLVCGAPLCGDHGCRNICGGLTGSDGLPHDPKGREQWEATR